MATPAKSPAVEAQQVPANATSASPYVDSGEAIVSLLIEDELVSSEQLRYARRVHSKLTTSKTLLKVMEELGYVSQAQLQETLRQHRISIPLGSLLVELGYLGKDELAAALAIQAERPQKQKLGAVLVEEHFIDELTLIDVLSCQLGFPHMEPHLDEIDKDLLVSIPPKICARHQLLPVEKRGDKIVVAFADPLDQHVREVAQRILGAEIVPVLATKAAIQEAVAAFEKGSQHQRVEVSDDNSAVGIVTALFDTAIRERVSDIHIEPLRDVLRVRYRRDGVLMPYKEYPKELAKLISSRIKVLAQADIAERRRHQDGKILYEDVEKCTHIDMRVSIYVTIFGEKIVIRLLNIKDQLLDIEDIGMPPRMLERFKFEALDVPTGVVIITGPTGSGKTTTLYSAVHYLNDVSTSIITAEDPVEYVVDGITQCSINPKISVTYEETLRHIVRQDPDVIVLGEVRDRFSAETAIQAALTGHKVLTTFHTEDSIGGLLRLMNMDIEAFLISSTVVCVVAQRLLRKVCSSCAEPYEPTPKELHRLGYKARDLGVANFLSGHGCSQCRFTGYHGRVGTFELLVLDEMVKEAILERKTSYEIRRVSIESSGLVTLLEDGIMKAADGVTTFQEVLRNLPRLSKPRPLPQIRRMQGV